MQVEIIARTRMVAIDMKEWDGLRNHGVRFSKAVLSGDARSPNLPSKKSGLKTSSDLAK